MNERQKELRLERLPIWNKMIESIFPHGIPSQCDWTNLDDITSVLNHIGKYSTKQKALNHMFYPTGGGMDLTGAYLSNERDCLELDTDGLAYIVKPKQLSFHSINKDPDWMYFRLDTHNLQPSGVYDYGEDEEKEEVTELSSGAYFDRGVWDYGYFDYDDGRGEVRLNSNARVVTRFFRGSIVIFCKFSLYNLVQGPKFNAYDAMHNKHSNADFRNFISSISDATPSDSL